MTASPGSSGPAEHASSDGPSGDAPTAHIGVQATGIGSLPGTDPMVWQRFLREVFGDDDAPGVPYLPELPGRGPGADLVGRGASLLLDLPVDLQPSGWRLVDRPGRDQARADAFLREDLDTLAEVFDGYVGPLKLQAAGPFTLAASIALPRGERVIADPGATRDVVDSLTDGLARHVERVARLVPGAALVLQLDEPSLTAVLEGSLRSDSGFSRFPALDAPVVVAGLRQVLAGSGAPHTLVHSCAPRVPLPVLREVSAMTGAEVSLDTALLSARGWEGLAVAVESGLRAYLGAIPTPVAQEAGMTSSLVAQGIIRRWEDLGLEASTLRQVTVTPACGLAGATAPEARAAQLQAQEVARRLADVIEDVRADS